MNFCLKLFALIIIINFSLILIYLFTTELDSDRTQRPLINDYPLGQNNANSEKFLIEIWSKSAIGEYFWESIIGGRIESKLLPNQSVDHDLYSEGTKIVGQFQLLFRTGPSLKPQSFNSFEPKNLILILNWRDENKINYSLKWIETVFKNNKTKNIGIIALGNEYCNNQWFTNQMNQMKNLRFVFLVYDSKLIDNQFIYQWPLGVATYRQFPSTSTNFNEIPVDLQTKRQYVCNFQATIYPNSTRESVYNLLIENDYNCLIKVRRKWQPNENKESMNSYVDGLSTSDLTICPSGLNIECYRILEAVEYGSIPIIEDISNNYSLEHSNCDQHESLRLFKHYNAPFIYVRNWTKELPRILKKFQQLDRREMIRKRLELIKWYYRFRIRLRNHFINVLSEKFENL